jgi:hypothetical protein
MSSQIDFKTLPANVPVMCISRVYPNITESRIRRIFDELDMGIIDRIDMVSKENEKGEKFNRIFIHFQRWNDTENGRISRERLLNGKEIKIIYDDPWFWKVSAYRKPEHKPNSHQQHKPQQQRAKPTIQFDSDDEDEKPREEKPKYQERPKSQEQYQERPKYQEKPRPQERPKPQKQYQQYKERPQKQYQEQYKDERPRPQEQYKDERPQKQYKQYKQYRDERPQKQYKEERSRPKSMVDNDLLTEEQEKHAVNYNVDPKKPPVKKMRKQNLSLESRGKPLNTEDLNTEDLNTEDKSKDEVEDGEVEDV